MRVRSKAPLRLGLAGGGSDVSPYSDLYGGCVLNASINMHAYCTIEKSDDGTIEFIARDLNEHWCGEALPKIEVDGVLGLHKAVYNRVVEKFNESKPLSLRVHTYSDAPPGCGLGSSSTMVVAILRAYQELLKLPLGEYDLAHLAYEIERVDCALAGGKQDQYAATFGGFNFMEFFQGDRVIVNPLRIREDIVNELEAHLMLYFTGRSRQSASIIQEQVNAATLGEEKSIEATHRVKQASHDMKEALLKSDIYRVGHILGESWNAKRNMADKISNSHVESVYEKALDAGALSAKLSGAGGGGVMMLFVDPVRRLDVIDALREEGGVFYGFQFSSQGAQGWTARL